MNRPMPKNRYRVICSCGWERECSSEWAAQSVSKLHLQLAPRDVAHVVVRVEGPNADAGGQQQFSLT
jgi:glycine cleavage system aminomethyltransferase T